MRLRRDDGSVLAADLVLAAAIVIVVAATASAFGTVAGAVQDDREAARNAAVIAARSGDVVRAETVARSLAPNADVIVKASPDRIAVWVGGPVEVAHPVLRRITLTAFGVAEVPIAPYRSNRG